MKVEEAERKFKLADKLYLIAVSYQLSVIS